VLPVVAVSIASNGDVELHLVILVVRLRLPQVPLDAGPSQHHAAGGGGGGGDEHHRAYTFTLVNRIKKRQVKRGGGSSDFPQWVT